MLASPLARHHLSARNDAGWSSLEARRAHNPEVAGSNPAPATTKFISDFGEASSSSSRYAQLAQLVEQRTENPRVSGSIPELGIFAPVFHLYGKNPLYMIL